MVILTRYCLAGLTLFSYQCFGDLSLPVPPTYEYMVNLCNGLLQKAIAQSDPQRGMQSVCNELAICSTYISLTCDGGNGTNLAKHAFAAPPPPAPAPAAPGPAPAPGPGGTPTPQRQKTPQPAAVPPPNSQPTADRPKSNVPAEIGRASCRERV